MAVASHRTDMDDPVAAAQRQRSAQAMPQPEQIRDESAEQIQARLFEFLQNYSSAPEGGDADTSMTGSQLRTASVHQYVHQAQAMQQENLTTMHIDFQHLLDDDLDLADALTMEYYRFEPALLQRCGVRGPGGPQLHLGLGGGGPRQETRVLCELLQPAVRGADPVAAHGLHRPPHERERHRHAHVRGAAGAALGHLHVLQVRHRGAQRAPAVPVYQAALLQEPRVPQPQRLPPRHPGERLRGRQRVKVQENSDEIPAGSMPRSIDVILRHEAVEQAKAGDKCIFTGMLVVIPDTSSMSRAGGATLAVRGDSNAGCAPRTRARASAASRSSASVK